MSIYSKNQAEKEGTTNLKSFFILSSAIVSSVVMFVVIFVMLERKQEEMSGLVATQFRNDLGNVKPGQQFPVSFFVTNESSKIIEVVDIKTSCGCLDPSIEKTTVAPKESVRVKVDWSTGWTHGKIESRLYVRWRFFDQTDTRELALTTLGTVVSDHSLSKKVLVFQAGEKATKSVHLVPSQSQWIEVLEATCSNPAFIPTIRDDRLAVDVLFDPDLCLINKEFGNYDNCPKTVQSVIWCPDTHPSCGNIVNQNCPNPKGAVLEKHAFACISTSDRTECVQNTTLGNGQGFPVTAVCYTVYYCVNNNGQCVPNLNALDQNIRKNYND